MASRIPHYCIVGGGISGLSTAYLLSLVRPPGSYRVTLLESQPRFGGWIRSWRNPDTGAVYEFGPHSARASTGSSQLLLRLALSLKFTPDSFVWMRSNSVAGQRFLYINNELVPISPLSVRAQKPFTRSPLGLIVRRLFSIRPSSFASSNDLSVDDFLRTRFDGEFADYFGSAMMRGIYAGDSKHLSAKACLPELIRFEQEGPNLLFGMLKHMITHSSSPKMLIREDIDRILPLPSKASVPSKTFAWSLDGGLQRLTDAMASALLGNKESEITLFTNTSVSRVESKLNKFVVHCSPNSSPHTIEDVDVLFMCCPAPQTAQILSDAFPFDSFAYLDPTRGLPWNDVATVVFELDKEGAEPRVPGFGHLVPACEDEHVLGCIYDSIALPQLDGSKGTIRYTLMMHPHKDWLEMTDETSLKEKIAMVGMDTLVRQLHLSKPRIVGHEASLLRSCIPQYPLGHIDKIKAIREQLLHSFPSTKHSRLHLVGYSYDGVGLGDVVHSALNAVSQEMDLS